MHRILLPIITLLLFFGGTLQAQMIADITQDVRTEFGVYHPYLVTITPNAEPYTVAPDFSNVVNFSDFNFTEVEKSLLAQNYFVVSPRREKGGTGYKEIYDIYNECREQDIPIFVTTDALLHTFHLLYDYVLKTVELKLLVADLNHLNKALLTIAEEQYQVATDSTVKEAAWRSVALLSIATVLLDTTFTVPTYVNSIVSAELALIKAQAGYSTSPLLGYPEDYSQYKVRGHYTTEEVLKPYFRSMMWLGRATLAVEGHPEVVRRHTRSALLLVQALERHLLLTAGTGVWDRIYLPTVFFVGKTDDLNYYHYKSLAHQVYGENFTYLPVGAFADTVALDQFIALAKELPGPRILTFTPKGFRLMGQRFIPDSYVTGKVVSSGRPMPRGLDPMVVLGSARACQILDQVFHDTGHFGILDSLAIEFKSMPDTVWAQNLYWNWLYCLMPLLFPKGEGYPPFMQNLAWVDKELYAALASWAELRHDTILYAKSSVTMGVHPESALLQGYVEPNPYFFARLAALTSYMLDGLSKQDLLFSEFDWRLRELEQLLLSLKTIAEKELTNHNLTGEEYELICNIGETIEKLVTTSGYGLEGPRYDSTDEMPVIADVHTDPVFTNCILEEGVGYPFNIFVICNVAGELVLTRGAGFSYYEFCQPIASGRLTDEEWKVMLKSDSPPEPPLWVGSFMDTTSAWLNKEPQYYYWQKKRLTTLAVSASSDTPLVGDVVEIKVASNGNFVSPPIIQIVPEQGLPFQLSDVVPDSVDYRGVRSYRAVLNTVGLAAGKVLVSVTADVRNLEWPVKVNYRYMLWLQPGSGVAVSSEVLPKSFLLLQNWPNPFNPETVINYVLPRACHVKLTVFNLFGQEVRVLINEQQAAGVQQISWDGRNQVGIAVGAGVYLFRLEAGEFTQTRKMVLLH